MSGFSREKFDRRTLLASVAGGVLWTGLIGRLVQLQLFSGEDYASLANENRIRLDPTPARRGMIYDRLGQKIATNKRSFYVRVVPEETEDFDAALTRIAELVPVSERKQRRLRNEVRNQRKFIPVTVAEDISWEEFSRLNVHVPELRGVYAEVGELRSYPMGAAFAHAIGYVAKPNREELDALIEARIQELGVAEDDIVTRRNIRDRLQSIYRHPDMRIGRQGMEQFAEAHLRGDSGFQRVAVNAQGRIVERLDSSDVAPLRGGDVVTSFDAEIQKFAINRFGEESGSAVVMDIASGDLLAMVSTPGFDPNDFVSGISHTKYNALLANEKSPLYHKAYDGVYPPGSTFKMIVAAAALEAGVSPEERVYCSGKTHFGGRDFHCWKREGHGSMNMHQAIQHSCDVYFYDIARKAGVERIAEMARRFGLGHVYELGINGGARGVIPDPAWKLEARGEPWFEGETLNFGIGQGYLSTTPLQLAVMTSRIAVDAASHAMSPRLIIGGLSTPQDDAPKMQPVSEEILQRLRDGMYAVTSEAGGTALRSGDVGNGVRLAGKTGTAQVRRITRAERLSGVRKNSELEWRFRDHALFVSYAPADNPKYVCVVVVDHGGGGSAVAAPIARDIMKETLRRDPMSRPVFTVSSPLADAAPSFLDREPI